MAKPQTDRRSFTPDSIAKFEVTGETTLMEFLISVLTDHKRTSIKNFLKHNQVKVGSEIIRQFDHQLAPGTTVSVNFTREFPQFYNRRMKLVYEDDDIIVANKGYGLLSMGNDKIKDGTAYSILKDYLKWVNPQQKIFIVHRLDRDTSGLIMFAKSIKAKENMQHNWNNMVLNRKYLAVVEGSVKNDEGTIRSYLAENSKYEVYSTDNPDEGQLAVTRYKVLRCKNGYSLLEVELDTGRKNQIRVHLKDIGHPIAGDHKYGAKSSPIRRLALHAQTLRFVHPITRKEMNFTTPVPTSFMSMVK